MGNNDKPLGMSGGVPAGWVLVPVEPTEAMVDAAIKATKAGLSPRNVVYVALAATPTPPIEGRDADVERVAEAMWNASPYYDGTAWDHVSLRRYQGTSDTREMYLTFARAALASAPAGEEAAFRAGAEAMQRALADALRDHLNSRAAAIANSTPLPEYPA